MCLPEKFKTKEINIKKQKELLQVIEDTRRRMQAETLLAASNIFCVWPGVCLTHSVADLGNNNNNNSSITNNNNVYQRNNNVQQRTRSRSHHGYENLRNSAGASSSRHRLQTATGNSNNRRPNPIINNEERNEEISINDEYTIPQNNGNIINLNLTNEPLHHFEEREMEIPPVVDNSRNDFFYQLQAVQQFQQLPVPNQMESIQPILQLSTTENDEISNSQTIMNSNVSHTNDTMFGGVLPLLNIFQFFRNI